MHKENKILESFCHGFRCKSGCFHIVWGSMMLSLTQDQFLVLTDVVNQMYRQLQEESKAIDIAEHLHSDSLLM